MKWVLHFLFAFLPLFVCAIVFAGSFDKWEMIVGAGAALLGALGICIVESRDEAHFRPFLRDWLTLWRLPWYLLTETLALLGTALTGRAESLFRLAPFDAGEECNPHDTGRRTLATVYTTMTPAVVVLGINVRDRYMLFHQLKRSPLGKMAHDLGANS